jgi:hypothetical protein
VKNIQSFKAIQTSVFRVSGALNEQAGQYYAEQSYVCCWLCEQGELWRAYIGMYICIYIYEIYEISLSILVQKTV